MTIMLRSLKMEELATFCHVNNIAYQSPIYEIVEKIFRGEMIEFPQGTFYPASVNVQAENTSLNVPCSSRPFDPEVVLDILLDACLTAKNFDLFRNFSSRVDLTRYEFPTYYDKETFDFVISILPSGDATSNYANFTLQSCCWRCSFDLIEHIYSRRDEFHLDPITDPNILFSISLAIAQAEGERKQYLDELVDRLTIDLRLVD